MSHDIGMKLFWINT